MSARTANARRSRPTPPRRPRRRPYYLSLGSNLGNKAENLARARALLDERGLRILRVSPIFRTEPVDRPGQPWFVNQVVAVSGPADPLDALAIALAVEDEMGRVRTVRRGPRTIDIDLLLAGRTVRRGRRLTLPHPRMHRRNFVLVPMAAVAPRVRHPVLRKTAMTLLKESPDTAAVIRLKIRPH